MFDFKFRWYHWILIILFGHPLISFVWGIIFGLLLLFLGDWVWSHINISWK